MDTLAKWLFPRNPRMVRYRKLQIVFIAVLTGSLALIVFGLLLYLLYQH